MMIHYPIPKLTVPANASLLWLGCGRGESFMNRSPRITRVSIHDDLSLVRWSRILAFTAFVALATATCGGGGGSNGTTDPLTPPSAPTGVVAATGNAQITVNWNAVTGATSYNLYWATQAGVTTTGGTKISNATGPYTHTGLTNGTEYYYIVTAENAGGESVVSSEVSASPLPPLPVAPTGLTATPGDQQIVLAWNDSPNATTYNAYWGTQSGVTQAAGTKIGEVASPYTHTGLTNGTTYYYVVTAQNMAGESNTSNEVNALTPQVTVADYFPLNVGTTWLYKHTDNPGQASETTDEVPLTVTESTTANDTTWYRLEATPQHDGPFGDGLGDATAAGGKVLLRVYEDLRTSTFVVLQEPLTAGATWPWATWGTVEIQSISVEVVTPAGTYRNVIKLRFHIPDDETSFFYLAPGVGLVKRTHGSPSDDTHIWEMWELKQFSPPSASVFPGTASQPGTRSR